VAGSGQDRGALRRDRRLPFRVPQEVHFGKGEVRKLPEIVARFGRRAFVVTGSRPATVSFADAVRWSVHGEPEIATADEGAKLCREAGCDVVVAIGGGSVLDTAKAAAALAANGGEALDYLEGDFEDYIAPIRALRIWPGILRTEGPQGVQEKAELALSRLNAFPQTFPDALKRFLGDLKLVGIDPLTIEATAMSFGSSVHSIGSVAYAMKPDAPNEAAFQLSSNTFIQAYDQFQQELDKIKQQITETRHKISSGDLG